MWPLTLRVLLWTGPPFRPPLSQVQADKTDLPEPYATGSDPVPAVGLRDLDALSKVERMSAASEQRARLRVRDCGVAVMFWQFRV